MGLGRAIARRLPGLLVVVFTLTVTVPVLVIAAYRVLPVPATPLMVIRFVEAGDWPARDWVALEDVPRTVLGALVASEDNNFCTHHGVDWAAVRDAYTEWQAGQGLRGASTLSMQVARNLLLWPGGGAVRKAGEVYLTVMVEALLPKRRIMEVYLNTAEWGPGVFGIAAAARHHYGVAVENLTADQAVGLVATLGAPQVWTPQAPSPRLAGRMRAIAQRLPDGLARLGCIGQV